MLKALKKNWKCLLMAMLFSLIGPAYYKSKEFAVINKLEAAGCEYLPDLVKGEKLTAAYSCGFVVIVLP